MQPKQYLILIPTLQPNEYIVATSKQHSKEVAQRDIYMRLDVANIPCKNKVYIRELIVDDDGTVRIVDEGGEVLPFDTWKVYYG